MQMREHQKWTDSLRSESSEGKEEIKACAYLKEVLLMQTFGALFVLQLHITYL